QGYQRQGSDVSLWAESTDQCVIGIVNRGVQLIECRGPTHQSGDARPACPNAFLYKVALVQAQSGVPRPRGFEIGSQHGPVGSARACLGSSPATAMAWRASDVLSPCAQSGTLPLTRPSAA